MKGQGTVISRFFSIYYFTITGVKKIVHYTKDFIISRFHCIIFANENQPYSEINSLVQTCVIFKIKLPLITSSVVHWSLLHSGLYGRSLKMKSQQRNLKLKQSSKETFPELPMNEQYSIPSFHLEYLYLTPLQWIMLVSLYVGHFISTYYLSLNCSLK